MALSERFIEYYKTTFFNGKEEEFQEFLTALEKGIPRTIRIRPGMEKEVIARLSQYGFILDKTYIPNVFSLGRTEDFDPLERRIGYTLDHLVGNFYIQELAAATSVHILSEGKIHTESFVILDMAASPGGKTTQLSEHYPNSFIIANEPTRERIPQLLQNLDRMGSPNIGVTLYPGQYFKHTPEMFDRILLDAPCSGEGTLYKGTDAVKHWHIKNIKTISRLQEKLIDSAIIALKVGGEMVYSTCSMNLLENEGVLEYIVKKYGDCFEITFEKRFWPHIDGTGGFFVSKIKKNKSIPLELSERTPGGINSEIKTYKGNISKYELRTEYKLYEHTGKVLSVIDHPSIENLKKMYYFMRLGERIGHTDNGKFLADPFIYRYVDISQVKTYELEDEEMLDAYLRGSRIGEVDIDDGEILLTYQSIPIARENIESSEISNHFPSDWRRK